MIATTRHKALLALSALTLYPTSAACQTADTDPPPVTPSADTRPATNVPQGCDSANFDMLSDEPVRFAPPIGQKLFMLRAMQRELHDSEFREKVLFRLEFSELGRGYMLRVSQIERQLDAPDKLQALLELGHKLREQIELQILIDRQGQIIGLLEPDDYLEDYKRAIARLKTQVQSKNTPQTPMLLAWLNQMGGLPRDELIASALALFRPLFLFAGQHVADNGSIMARSGDIYRLRDGDTDGAGLVRMESATDDRASSKDADPVANEKIYQLVLSRCDGLVWEYQHIDRLMSGPVGRHYREEFQLMSDPDPSDLSDSDNSSGPDGAGKDAIPMPGDR